MKHVSLDLETMGTDPGDAIMSIGAVQFQLDRPLLGDRFYRVINLKSCQEVGLTIKADTLMWWLGQSEAARNAIMVPAQTSLFTALQEFADWLKNNGTELIWGHGAAFDPVLLAAAYRASGMPVPWTYRATRDTRTIHDASFWWPDLEWTRQTRLLELPGDRIEHHALHDAVMQARGILHADHIVKSRFNPILPPISNDYSLTG